MKKGEYLKILMYRLKQEVIYELNNNINNYLNLFEDRKKNALIIMVIEDSKREDGLTCDKLEEQQYYILLDDKYENIVEKARKTVLQSLKAKQIKERKAIENSKEYKKAQLQKEFDETLQAIFKESGRLAKKGLGTIGLIGISSAIGFAKGCKEENKSIFK